MGPGFGAGLGWAASAAAMPPMLAAAMPPISVMMNERLSTTSSEAVILRIFHRFHIGKTQVRGNAFR
jgi:hypothetical protein